jgi:ferredoxin
VVLGRVRRVEDLPVGWRDRQAPGAFRLERADDARVFGVVNGPGSLKPLVFAPREPLLQVEISGPREAFRAEPALPEPETIAVLGVRACDLAALAVQDRIFLQDRIPDPWYAARRRGLFLVAASCTRSVATCFCTSMGTGPEARAGFDLALTELDAGFLLRAGSPAGAELAAELHLPAAAAAALADERRALDACAAGIGRRLETRDLPELLYANLDHPRWDEVAERCLSCGNCTMVCPTCFCHDERDEPDLSGARSLRVREWDSCFDRAHAQVHGQNFRPRIRDRYRQWLVHKLAGWVDQFGSSGCVGCGRCITWCPVGIDLTEEVAAIRGNAP